MKRVQLECGGKSPNIIFADCDDLDYTEKIIIILQKRILTLINPCHFMQLQKRVMRLWPIPIAIYTNYQLPSLDFLLFMVRHFN